MDNIISYSNHPLYRASRACVTSLLSILFRIRIVGVEHIPQSGPLIVSSNHIHNFDPPLLGCVIPRFVHFMAKSELFKIKWVGRFLTILGAFPVHRGNQDKAAIRVAISIPRAGNCLVIFPEGHRSKTGELGEARPGVAFIARKAACPIIPAAVIGPYKLFRPLTIRFGEPIDVKPNDTNEVVLKLLVDKIQSLLEQGHAS